MVEHKKLITAQELAVALNLSVETIWRYTRERRIPYMELGSKQYRYNLREVLNALTGAAVREKPSKYKGESQSEQSFTYQDYLQMPEEPGYRYEVLEGVLIKDPSPNMMHQRASRELQRLLMDYFWEVDPEGEVFDAPLDVTFGDLTVVQPDLLYVTGGQKKILQDARIDGPPALVVEILSPFSIRKDRLQKMTIYQKAGVQHYWIVDPEDRTIECYSLQDGLYARVAAGMDREVVEHPGFPGLSIPLQQLWEGRRKSTAEETGSDG